MTDTVNETVAEATGLMPKTSVKKIMTPKSITVAMTPTTPNFMIWASRCFMR